MSDDETTRGAPTDEPQELEIEEVDGEQLDAILEDALRAVGGRAEEAEGPPDPLARLQAELDAARDRSVRALADFDNYRKRIDRERAEERRYAGFGVLLEVLGVMDNLERALAAAGDVDDLKRGVEMIVRQMQDLLRRHGVERVPAAGVPFDPAVHEAVSRFEDPGVREPRVSAELQAGYMMHERLLRPAMVRVALPAEGVAASGQEDSGA